MTCIDRQYRHIPKDDIRAYEATGWRVVADFADCHHGAHAVMMELVEAALPDAETEHAYGVYGGNFPQG